jgi:hypothetical protein
MTVGRCTSTTTGCSHNKGTMVLSATGKLPQQGNHAFVRNREAPTTREPCFCPQPSGVVQTCQLATDEAAQIVGELKGKSPSPSPVGDKVALPNRRQSCPLRLLASDLFIPTLPPGIWPPCCRRTRVLLPSGVRSLFADKSFLVIKRYNNILRYTPVHQRTVIGQHSELIP